MTGKASTVVASVEAGAVEGSRSGVDEDRLEDEDSEGEREYGWWRRLAREAAVELDGSGAAEVDPSGCAAD